MVRVKAEVEILGVKFKLISEAEEGLSPSAGRTAAKEIVKGIDELQWWRKERLGVLSRGGEELENVV